MLIATYVNIVITSSSSSCSVEPPSTFYKHQLKMSSGSSVHAPSTFPRYQAWRSASGDTLSHHNVAHRMPEQNLCQLRVLLNEDLIGIMHLQEFTNDRHRLLNLVNPPRFTGQPSLEI